jgi:diaminopimelate decarboxylase
MMAVAHLLAAHGSPLWLVDLDRLRRRVEEMRAAWAPAWDDVWVAYSYKTNRMLEILTTLDRLAVSAEVASEAEYALARDAVCAGAARIVVNGPAPSAALLARAGEDDALVVLDSPGDLERAAAAGVRRAGLRVALPTEGAEPGRLGTPARDVPDTVRRAARLGLAVEVLAAHRVSIGLRRPLSAGRSLAGEVEVRWPPPAGRHAAAARALGALARTLADEGRPIAAVDLGGGLPSGAALRACAAAVGDALRAEGFRGRLVVEPGRALVADVVDLACTVVAAKTLADGTSCLVVDAGTSLLPGALWAWPRLEAVGEVPGEPRPTMVSGPLCLDVDVLHPAAPLPPLGPGDALVAREVGAYQEAHSTRFGDFRPGAVARDGGEWRVCRRRENLDDLLAAELRPLAGLSAPSRREAEP